ncbi:unnamed protein product [Schistocephalus solidus]|uniref:Non-specific serine/threonine protein kinase n=1 Tax=Schistocephalus solidus TaxID=70667 RepID=A0A183SYL4_SCHSO|nr:unnamed protein product [Schistocephalus solidus]
MAFLDSESCAKLHDEGIFCWLYSLKSDYSSVDGLVVASNKPNYPGYLAVGMEEVLSRFTDGLKSPFEDARLNTALKLRRFIGSELKEISPHNYALFIEDLCSEFKCMLEGSDINEKRGAILGIGCLAEVDFVSISAHCGHFTSLVKSLAASGDLPTLVLGARLLGQLGLLFSNDFVDLQIKSACDSLPMANQSNSQKEFNILLLREIALHTPTSFYQHLEQFLKAVLPRFREKEVIVRDLAAMALRSALAISAENEVSCQGQESLSSAGRLGEASDSPDALFYSQSAASDAGGARKPVGRGASLLGSASRKISQVQIPTDIPPMIWYQACVRELLFKYSDAIALKPSDQHSANKYSPSYRKMTPDEWMHGRLLILNELLVSANPEFEKIRSSLDTMLGQTEGESAVQTVHLTQWAVVSAPTAAAAAVAATVSSGLPRSALSSTAALPTAEVFGDEGIASELFRQQQLRQQRAVSVASAACRRVLADNLEQVHFLAGLALPSFSIPFLSVALKPTSFFASSLIATLMNFLFDCINRDREKPYALVTLGLMAQSLGADFEADGYLTQLFAILSSLISTSKEAASKKRSPGLFTAVLLTVGLLTKALGSKVCPYLKPLLDPIISRGLSKPMAAVCSLIAENVPELKRSVQDNLLKRINLVLANASAAGTLLSSASGGGGLMPQSMSAAAAMTAAAAAPMNTPTGGRFSVVGTSRLVAAFTPHRLSISRSPLLPSSTGATGRTAGITLPGTAALPIGWGEALGGLLKSGGGTGAAFDHDGTGGDPLSDSMLAAVALQTLGSFDFEGPGTPAVDGPLPRSASYDLIVPEQVLGLMFWGQRSDHCQARHALAYFVKHTADNFVSISNCSVKEIRLEGVRTCLRLMLPWIKSAEDMSASLRKTLDAMSDILGKLLIVGTSDPDPDVRQCVFNCLDFHFDNYVAQSNHLSSLFVALNDEVFAIRCLVMQCLGRLSEINPACVQPTLRKALLGLLIDLSDSGSSRNKEESASLLATLVATSPRFVAPYAEPLLHILVPQIRNALPISLRLRLIAMRNARLQRSAAKLGGADFFDCQKASLTTALLTSQSAAHAAAQTVQAVATATARAGGVPGSSGGVDKATGTASTGVRGGGNASGANQQLFGARAIAAANHAATTASIAAKVVAAAVGRQGLGLNGPSAMLLDDFENFNSTLGFPLPPRVMVSNLDLLIGDPNESLPGTNQDFLSVAAEVDLTNLTNALSSMGECLDEAHSIASKGVFCTPKTGQPEGTALAMWREPTPVVVALFSVLGHLSGVCPAAIVPLMDDLLPILACMLQDSTCYAKRSVGCVVSFLL